MSLSRTGNSGAPLGERPSASAARISKSRLSPTSIEWADYVWNPTTGCSKVGEGCRNCYAKTLHDQRHRAYLAGKKTAPCYAVPFEQLSLHPDRLAAPLRTKKPGVVFVDSMSDLFHEDVPFEFVDHVFAVMGMAHWHRFVILTKRPGRMREYLTQERSDLSPLSECLATLYVDNPELATPFPFDEKRAIAVAEQGWPLPNVWCGFSAWDQASFDAGWAELARTPAAKRIVSLEPLLGPVNLVMALPLTERGRGGPIRGQGGLDWAIVGGESGKGARPTHPDWVRILRNQCQEAEVPFFFKQWGEWRPWYYGNTIVYRIVAARAGATLDGREWREFPADYCLEEEFLVRP